MPCASADHEPPHPVNRRGLHKPAISPYTCSMKTILMILTGLGMLATIGTLFAGMLGMAKGERSAERSNRLMRARVICQGVTLALFALLLSMG